LLLIFKQLASQVCIDNVHVRPSCRLPPSSSSNSLARSATWNFFWQLQKLQQSHFLHYFEELPGIAHWPQM
jgi:hypothetical protein